MALTPTPYILSALAGALIAGGGSTYFLGSKLRQARDDVVSMRNQRDGAIVAADECSQRVEELALIASERARAADAARKRADKEAARLGMLADAVLQADVATCDDAERLAQKWLGR